MELKKVNENLDTVTIEDIENHKLISDEELDRDIYNLLNYSGVENTNSFFGNPFQYHFQLKNILKCKRDNGKTIYDLYNDESEWDKLLDDTRKRNRGGRTAAGNVYECFRINKGSIVVFKATAAKYIYNKYGANKVVDPTAGWGGRMLGAWSHGIDYTGIDINIEMRESYEDMISYIQNYDTRLFDKPNINMIWDSCLDVDYSNIEYDFVLTSPPYVNMEVYEHMEVWKSNEVFYKDFLNPLFENLLSNIQKGGKIAFNISPKMYDDAIKYGLTKCDIEEDLIQQLGQQKGKKRQDKIYIWKKG